MTKFKNFNEETNLNIKKEFDRITIEYERTKELSKILRTLMLSNNQLDKAFSSQVGFWGNITELDLVKAFKYMLSENKNDICCLKKC